MTEQLYYYVCDKCGSLADIAAEKHEAGWACADCGSEALWEFTDATKAQQHGNDIRDRAYNAAMASLDAALARIPK